ncbi:MAG: M23 family metallopeptidase [Phocaeicola sp.]
MSLHKQIIVFGFLFFSLMQLQAQQTDKLPTFVAPFDFPLLLSGGFGELRTNHFHGGLDFKTQGVVGKPIRNIAAGYVSRAVVTPGGYGQALYVTHSNGYTSVYGHLLRFAAPIQKRIDSYQDEHEQFSVDLHFDPTEFPFEAGEIIAFSGNEGYSFGPHLHMEIRETESGNTIDPLQFYKDLIKDTTPPRASSIVIYPQPGRGVVDSLAVKKRILIEKIATPIQAWGDVGVGIEAFDYMDGTQNNYGVRKITLSLDNQVVFRSTVDKVYPTENRMINAWIDYEERQLKRRWIMQSYLLPGTNLHQLESNETQGIITIDKERAYHLKYELEDLHGNCSSYTFTIQGKKQIVPPYLPIGIQMLNHKTGNVIQDFGIELVIPRGALYSDVDLNRKILQGTDTVARSYQLHDKPVPLYFPCSLRMRVPLSSVADSTQYYIAQIDKKGSTSVGGTYQAGWVEGTISELGTYAVAVDSLPPRITPLNKKEWAKGNIQFRIKDDETGIRSYKAYVDGKFVLFKYDLKSNRLLLKHPQRLKAGKNRTLKLYVVDRCGNETVEEYLF